MEWIIGGLIVGITLFALIEAWIRIGFRNREISSLEQQLTASNSERDINRAGSIAAQERVAELTEIVANQSHEVSALKKAHEERFRLLDHQSRDITNLQELVDNRDRRINALGIRSNIGMKTLAKILWPAKEIHTRDTIPTEIKKENDHRMLQFLARFQVLIAHDVASGLRTWDKADIRTFFHNETRQYPFSLRERLLDLMRHRNEEYVEVLYGFPPDIRAYFMDVTVTKERPPAT